jgi:hypothetical protein
VHVCLVDRHDSAALLHEVLLPTCCGVRFYYEAATYQVYEADYFKRLSLDSEAAPAAMLGVQINPMLDSRDLLKQFATKVQQLTRIITKRQSTPQ